MHCYNNDNAALWMVIIKKTEKWELKIYWIIIIIKAA